MVINLINLKSVYGTGEAWREKSCPFDQKSGRLGQKWGWTPLWSNDQTSPFPRCVLFGMKSPGEKEGRSVG